MISAKTIETIESMAQQNAVKLALMVEEPYFGARRELEAHVHALYQRAEYLKTMFLGYV